MCPPHADVFRPPAEATYSKEAVNRAGDLLRVFFSRPPIGPGEPNWGDFKRDEVIDAMYALTWWKQGHARSLSNVGAKLYYHVKKENGEVDGEMEVAQRLKKRDTIIGKLNRYPKMKLTRMHDIGGVRATLPSLQCLTAVSRRLRKNWTIINTRDYIAEPKVSGYRAIHHEVRHAGKVIEVQLRTVRQHAWANQVEDDGRARGTGYKFGFGDDDIHSYYRAVSDVFWAMDAEQPLREGLQDELRSSYDKIRDVLRPQSPREKS